MSATRKFDQWSGVRLLITGGAGFIGSHLARVLVKAGATVRVVDNLERGSKDSLRDLLPHIELRVQDLRSPDVSMEACRDIDIVFHLASKVGGIRVYQTSPSTVLCANALVDLQVVQAAQRCGVKRFVYASSGHVYPQRLQQSTDSPPLSEADALPAEPGLSYGWAKLFGEKAMEYSFKEFPVMETGALRIVGAYGPGQDAELATGSAIPVFIRRTLNYPNEGPFTVLGTGKETRSYCFIDDVVEGLIMYAEKLGQFQSFYPLNLGSEERIAIEDLVTKIIGMSHTQVPIVFDPTIPTEIWGQVPDCAEIRRRIGWSPRVSLEDGLRICFDAARERVKRTQR